MWEMCRIALYLLCEFCNVRYVIFIITWVLSRCWLLFSHMLHSTCTDEFCVGVNVNCVSKHRKITCMNFFHTHGMDEINEFEYTAESASTIWLDVRSTLHFLCQWLNKSTHIFLCKGEGNWYSTNLEYIKKKGWMTGFYF